MELQLGWHPPLYVSCSFLLMFLFPLFTIPVLRARGVWLTTAPVLLTLMPLFLSITLAYLGVRWAFVGIAKSGTTSPVVIAAGLAEPQWFLKIGAIFSGIALVIAFGIAIWRSRHANDGASPVLGRRAAIAIVTAGLILLCGVSALSFVSFHARSNFDVLERLHLAMVGGACASGALLIVTIIVVVRLARSAPAVAGANPKMLAVPLVILIATGATSWWIEQWFLRIVRHGL